MSKIVHLSEAASIAIHAMVFVAQADTHVNVNIIASEIGASKNHLAKVMQVLTKKRFLKSVRGPSG
ncbi:MAG: Rrf2 family transcriptional regulator, partial [Bacteroidota bacterium]